VEKKEIRYGVISRLHSPNVSSYQESIRESSCGKSSSLQAYDLFEIKHLPMCVSSLKWYSIIISNDRISVLKMLTSLLKRKRMAVGMVVIDVNDIRNRLSHHQIETVMCPTHYSLYVNGKEVVQPLQTLA